MCMHWIRSVANDRVRNVFLRVRVWVSMIEQYDYML